MDELSSSKAWSWWRKIAFRFTSIYAFLYCFPPNWLLTVPPNKNLIGQFSFDYMIVVVEWFNEHLFHLKDTLVQPLGTGDTSYMYAQLCFFTLISIVGTLTLSIFDKRPNYEKAYYWLLILLRYYVAMVSLRYGIIKLFGNQMPSPTISQLVTPLGDLSAMRLTWVNIGYSIPFEFFTGLMECLVGVLLLFRRTTTLGAFLSTGVYLYVVILNLSYNVCVKLFSIHLFIFSVVLLTSDLSRFLDFFIFNVSTVAKPIYVFQKQWMRNGRMLLKIGYVLLFVGFECYKSYNNPILKAFLASPKNELIATGVFEVEKFETKGLMATDSLRWQNVVFEKSTTGSIQTSDTIFRQRYGRGYFSYKIDSLKHHISFKKRMSDNNTLFTLQYSTPDSNTILLKGKVQNDSIMVLLRRSKHHYQLSDKRFDWMLESIP